MRARRLATALGDEDVRSLGRRGGVLLVGEVVAGVLAVVLAVLLTRGLGVDDYGRYAVIVTAVFLVGQVIDLRVWEAATKYAMAHLTTGRELGARAVLELALLVNLAGGLLAALLLLASAGLIAGEFADDQGLAGAVRLFAWVAPLAALQFAARATLRVFDQFRLTATLTALAPALRIGAAAIALGLGSDVWGVLVALLVAEALATAAFVAAALVEIDRRLPAGAGFRVRVAEVTDDLPEMGRFLLASNASSSLLLVGTRIDVLIAGLLAGPATAGTVKLARTFSEPLTLLWRPFHLTIYGDLVRAVTERRFGEMVALLRRTTAVTALALTPIAVVIAALSPFLIPALAGPGFDDAALTLVPMIAGALIGGIFFWKYPAALALDMRGTALLTLTAATAVGVGLLFLLIPPLGPVAAGLAYLALVVIWTALLAPPVLARIKREAGSADPAGGRAAEAAEEDAPPDRSR
jgi:O-antigen/teichoic acid export membrane protein